MADQDDLFAGTDVVPLSPEPAAQERVIRFGKYKSQPYEVLLADASYSLWLLSSMFAKLQEQHPALLAFLVNRFGQPDSTPEHNRLQNRFLDHAFALRFALAVSAKLRRLAHEFDAIDLAAAWARHVQTVLHREKDRASRMSRYEKRDSVAKLRDSLLEQARGLAFTTYTGGYSDNVWTNAAKVTQLQFEQDGADVIYLVECGAALEVTAARKTEPSEFDDILGSVVADPPRVTLFTVGGRDGFRIELKPIVGDDYPAILRAMKAVKGTHLLVGEYCGAGATWDQVVRVFSLSGIVAIQLEDVERVVIPESLERAAVPILSDESAQDVVRTAYAALTA